MSRRLLDIEVVGIVGPGRRRRLTQADANWATQHLRDGVPADQVARKLGVTRRGIEKLRAGKYVTGATPGRRCSGCHDVGHYITKCPKYEGP